MKNLLRKWLGIDSLISRTESAKDYNNLLNINSELQQELGRTQKHIGAIYDYLGVRPQKTFVQDFSRLPDEAIPSMEIIKVEKVKFKKFSPTK